MPDLIKPAEDIPITELRGSLMSSVSGQTITCRKPNRGFLVIKMDGWASPNPIPIYMAGRLLDHPMQESQVRKTSFKWPETHEQLNGYLAAGHGTRLRRERDPVYGAIAIGKETQFYHDKAKSRLWRGSSKMFWLSEGLG